MKYVWTRYLFGISKDIFEIPQKYILPIHWKTKVDATLNFEEILDLRARGRFW